MLQIYNKKAVTQNVTALNNPVILIINAYQY